MKKIKFSKIAIILVIMAIPIYLIFIKPHLHEILGGEYEFETVYVAERDSVNNKKIAVINDKVFLANLEGVEMLDYDKRGSWSKAYHFRDLSLINSGEYLATVDITGKQAFVFDYDRKLSGKVETEHEIVYADMNSAGYLALITTHKDKQSIMVYDKNADSILSRVSYFKDSGYPVFVKLANKGGRALASYLNVKNAKVESVITFFDFSSKGRTLESRVFGYKTFSDDTIFDAYFLDDTHLALHGAKGLYFYRFANEIEEIKRVDFKVRPSQVYQQGDKLVVNYSDCVGEVFDKDTNKVIIYAKDGDESGAIELARDVKISVDDNTIYILDDNNVIAYKGARSKWSASLDKDVSMVYALGSKLYLVVYKDNFEILKIKDF